MPNKNLLERTGYTVSDLEEIYREEGSLDRVAARVGCSRPTIIKYLKHIEKDPTPWKTRGRGPSLVIASEEWRGRVFDEVEGAILDKPVWMDLKQRKIPKGFIKGIYFELPEHEVPVIPLYTVLRDGTRTVLLHVIKESNSEPQEQEEEREEPQGPGEPVALSAPTAGTLPTDPDDRRDQEDRIRDPEGEDALGTGHQSHED